MSQAPELLVSFWKIALNNFPEGDFRHRKLATKDAVTLINNTENKGEVFFSTEADIGAPYGKRELQNTTELVKVLSEHFAINVGIKDFFSEMEDGMSCALPTSLYDIRANRPLLVITCCYVLDREKKGDNLGMSVDPNTVDFHLFELIEPNAP